MNQERLDAAVSQFSVSHAGALSIEFLERPKALSDCVIMSRTDYDRLCGIVGEFQVREQSEQRTLADSEIKARNWDRLMLRFTRICEACNRIGGSEPFMLFSKIFNSIDSTVKYRVNNSEAATVEEALIDSLNRCDL